MTTKRAARKARRPQKQAEMVIGGAGEWIFRGGKFYDPNRRKYIIKCRACKKAFYATRIDAKSCSPACRKVMSRLNSQYKAS